ncbi:hypothetical protein WN943_027193 [Citrus x changshan-huyou]
MVVSVMVVGNDWQRELAKKKGQESSSVSVWALRWGEDWGKRRRTTEAATTYSGCEDSFKTLLCMKLSLDWTEMLKAFIFGTFNPAVGIGAVLVYIIITDPNNSLSTGDKVLTAICFLAFECFMILILFLLAVAQWYNYLRLWREDEDWEKLYVYPPDAVDCKAEDRRIRYLPHYLVWESVAILVINYFHLAVEHIVYKISRGAPEFIYYGVKNAAGPGLGQPEDEAASNPGFT